MGTPKKRYKYTAVYTDGSYITYELTREDYKEIEDILTADGQATNRPKFASISIGIVGLDHIRSIVLQKEEEIEQPEEEQPLENIPVLDQESYEWLKAYMGGKD